MSRRALKTRTDVCQLCNFLLHRNASHTQPYQSRKSLLPSRAFTTSSRSRAHKPQTSNQITSLKGSSVRPVDIAVKQASKVPNEVQLETFWKEVKAACDNLLSSSDKIPTEQETLAALRSCNSLAEFLVLDHSSPSIDRKIGATSALLSLDESPSAKKVPTHKLPTASQRMVNELSKLAYSIIKHPTVFITPQVLDIYTDIQAHLGKPQTFPEVFHLYANKPVPHESSPIRYSKQNPNKISNAIPIPVADRALQVAIDSKQLVVAMDIIESTYTTTAFHHAKFVRKCLLPATGVAVAPVAAYTIASQLALLQTTMDSAMATNVAFAGILAYTFFTGTIGVVAITTANDQMDRVTWAQGMPLRERWIREEERAAIDKIAGAWGFRESWRRGEEEGEDWDALREWIGGKGMILDRVELMEGME